MRIHQGETHVVNNDNDNKISDVTESYLFSHKETEHPIIPI